METFEINLAGEVLTVQANENDSFTIFKGGERVCDLWPEVDIAEGTVWSSEDGIDEVFVKQVGELIEEYYM